MSHRCKKWIPHFITDSIQSDQRYFYWDDSLVFNINSSILDWNCYLLLITFSISSARLISRFVIASTSNDFKESLTVFQLMVIIG